MTSKFLKRKREIVDSSAKLFVTKGYDKVTVNDILNELKIAKGTFYHYFKSKYDLLNEIIDIEAGNLQNKIDYIIDKKEGSAIEKINALYQDVGNYKLANKKIMVLMTKYLYRDENYTLRHKMFDRVIKVTAKKLGKIIRQGVAEKLFHTDYPDTIALVILNMGFFLRDGFAEMILGKKDRNSKTIQNLSEQCYVLEDSIEKLLGAPKNSIHVVEYELLESFFNS